MTFGNRRGGGSPIQFPSPGSLKRLQQGRPLVWVVAAFLLLSLLFTSFYTLEAEQIGVVLRFGRYVRTASPGLHFKLPFGIETVMKVPVLSQLKAEFGFRTVRADVESQFATHGYEDESSMLTGDLNAAVVEWVVQYRIDDPRDYLFKVRHVEQTFRDMGEAVMRQVIGDRTVNEVLTVGRQDIEAQVKTELQALANQYETGIRVTQVVLQTVNPPDPVKPSFNEVNQAEQDRERLINEAQSQYNKVVPRADGEAHKTIEQAEGYALDRVNRAKGDAARFTALYEEFRKAPEVTRKRLYLETMNRILPKSGRKIVVDEGVKGLVPLLDFGAGGTAKAGAAAAGAGKSAAQGGGG